MPEDQLFDAIEQEAGAELYEEIYGKVEALKSSLNDDQKRSLREIEDLYSSLIGRAIRVSLEKQ